MNSSKELAKIIKYHRKKSGLTQKQLAELAGVGKTVVYDVEKGKETVQWNTIIKILHVLNISITFESKLMSEFYKTAKTELRDTSHA